MLLRRLKLVNYGGIFNGLGLYEIEIDFTRCKNRIILIKGDNGSGKSTIEGALKPLPDDNSSFISGKDAVKEIEYFDEICNVVYSIRFIHECKGMSRTTKGYISKNGIELNPSGNITSCKDVIFEELQLDPNYIALSQLSATKRGIADLKPAERKRYVNAILTNTDVYNDMYKVLSKKASVYKGMIQSITSKIDNTGNVAQLEEAIKRLDEQIQEMEDMIEQHNEIMNKEKGMLQATDPDNKLREKIERFENTLKEYTKKRDETDKELRKLYGKEPELATATITPEIIAKMNARQVDISNEASGIKSRISSIIASRETDNEELQAKNAKLRSINSNGSLYDVKKLKSDLTAKKKSIEKKWYRIDDLEGISSQDFMDIYNVIVEMIDIIAGTDILTCDLDVEYRNTISRMSDIDDEIEKIVNFNNRISTAEDKVFILEQRPATCTDNTCPFIADALKAKKELDAMLEKRRAYKNSISNLNKEKDHLQEHLLVIDKSRHFRNLYSVNHRVLKILNIGCDDLNATIFTLKRDSGNIMCIMRELLDYTNDLDEYRTIVKSLTDIENKYHALSSQEDFINMIQADIDRLNQQVNKDNKTIEMLNSQLDALNNEYKSIKHYIDTNTLVLNYINTINECNDAIRILNEEIESNKASIDRIQQLNSDIEKITVNLTELKTQIKPLKEKKASYEFKLKASIEYSKELEEHKRMYEKIDTLKYYCSPTTGIQLLFANMYLNKILDSANRILSGLFGGIFALLPLVVSENEFRIPVAVNGGINHDDITSMSSAQISLISMIISIALLSQTSTKLNIIVGDEIDAPFDSENRREFISILYQLMYMVNASQCVLITHNSEIPMDDCDIILLKSDNDVITTGNIIWSYR